jgi:hypothetical protein
MSLQKMTEKLTEEEFRTRRGNALNRQAVLELLRK